jgi:long-chain acyl-CoA synthetase
MLSSVRQACGRRAEHPGAFAMTDAATLADQPWPAMSIAHAYALMTGPGSVLETETKVIRGVEMKVWKNAPPTLREVLAIGRTHGERIFLVHEDERVSFDAFHRATAAFARALQAAGVVKGDRVAIVMRNLPEWPVAFFAATAIGAIATPLNAWWTGGELEYGLTDSGAKVLVVDAERLERLAEHLPQCPDLQRVFVARSVEEIANPTITRMEEAIGEPDSWAALPDDELPPVALETDDDAFIFYTSGTTGKPKGALGTHRNICHNILAGAVGNVRTFLRKGQMPPAPDPTGPQKGSLLSIPFFHATGCFAVLVPSLFGGAKLAMMRKFDPIRALS